MRNARVEVELKPTQVGPRQIAEAAEHVGAAGAALRASCEFSADGAATAPQYIERWLHVALEALEGSARRVYLDVLRCDVASLGFAMDDSIVAV